MNFGEALEAVKAGKCVARAGWNGKNQYIFLAEKIKFYASEADDYGCAVMDSLAIKTTSDVIQVGWLASQSDMLSSDWSLVDCGKSPISPAGE